jgi:type VI secretion system protein ImpJ
MTVYLCVKRLNDRGNNVSELESESEIGDIKTRYVTVTNAKKYYDYHGAGPAIPLMSVQYALSLIWEPELDDMKDVDVMPIAQLFKSEKGVVLSPTYVPPCLRINSSLALKNQLLRIRDEMTLRTNQLEEYKTTVDRTGEDLGERVIAYRLALQLMSNYTAQLYHIIEMGSMHPSDLYGFMRQMVGGLSTMNADINFLGLTSSGESLVGPYQHADLEKCLGSMERGIMRMMDVVTTGGESTFHLEKDEKGLFSTHLSEPAVSPSSNFYLTLITEAPFEDELLPSFLKQAKMASLPKVRDLIEYALPSLPVKHLRNQPEGTRRIPNSHFFIVSKESDLWDDIRARRSIAVNWDEAPQDLKIQIIITQG